VRPILAAHLIEGVRLCARGTVLGAGVALLLGLGAEREVPTGGSIPEEARALLGRSLGGLSLLVLVIGLGWIPALRRAESWASRGGRLPPGARRFASGAAQVAAMAVLAWVLSIACVALVCLRGHSPLTTELFREVAGSGPAEPVAFGIADGWVAVEVPRRALASRPIGPIDLPVRVRARVFAAGDSWPGTFRLETQVVAAGEELEPPRIWKLGRSASLRIPCRVRDGGSPGTVQVRLRLLTRGVRLRLEPDAIRVAGRRLALYEAGLRLGLLGAGLAAVVAAAAQAMSGAVRPPIACAATGTCVLALILLAPGTLEALRPATWIPGGLSPPWSGVGLPWALAFLVAALGALVPRERTR
jgi:hypothetical protein